MEEQYYKDVEFIKEYLDNLSLEINSIEIGIYQMRESIRYINSALICLLKKEVK